MNNRFTASQVENLLRGAQLLMVSDGKGCLGRIVSSLFRVSKSELNGCMVTLNQEPEFGTKGGGW